MSTANLTAVIPVYNEAATIAHVCRRSRAQLASVVVVDDASDDQTTALLAEEDVTLLRHTHNQGKASTLWTGMRYAIEHGAAGVITLDGDGQHAPENIPRLIGAIEAHPDCIIVAARVRNARSAPRLRRFANRVADFWIGWACGAALYDSQSGFRYYPASLIHRLDISCGMRRDFVFESEVLIEAAWLGVPIVAIPVESICLPDSRVSYYRPVRDTACIARMVAGRLLRRGFYLTGLLRGLQGRVRWHEAVCTAPPPLPRTHCGGRESTGGRKHQRCDPALDER